MTTALLPLRLHLDTDLFLQTPADPARRATTSVIPGRTLQGLLAYALRNTPAQMLELAVQGHRLRIGPAYPDPTTSHTTLPAPASWAVAHTTRMGVTTSPIVTLHHRLDPDATIEPLPPLVTITDRLVTPTPVRAHTTTRTPTSRATHTVLDTAGPFLETVIEAHQSFRTLWRLDYPTDTDRDQLLHLLSTLLCQASHQHRFRLGGAQGSAGGTPRITTLTGSTTLTPDDLIDPTTLHPSGWHAGTTLTVLLTAPTVTGPQPPGLTGLPTMLLDTLATACGTPDTATLGPTWITTTRYGGYHRLYRGFVAETWAAAPGSTLELTATRDHTPAELGRWLTAGLGGRHSEGCGWFTLLDPAPRSLGQPAHDITPRDGHGKPITLGTTAPATDHPSTDPVAGLQHHLFAQTTPDLVRNWALTWPSPAPGTGPSAHLWGRLADALSGWHTDPQPSLDTLTSLLTTGLASPALTSLATPLPAAPSPVAATTVHTLITTITAASHDPDTRVLDQLADQLTPAVLPGLDPHSSPADTARDWLRAHRSQLLAQALMTYLRHQRRIASGDRP